MNESGTQYAPSFLLEQTQRGLKRGGKSVHWSPLLISESTATSGARRDNEKSSFKTLGPPLRSLMDDPPPDKQFRGSDSPFRLPGSASTPAGYSFTNLSNRSLNTNSFAFSTTNGNAMEDSTGDAHAPHCESDYWVTVFGFPSEQTSAILDLFSKHGDIVSHKSPESGNWLHLRYSSTIHASQALARNGKIFNGMMIGVVPCTDEEAIAGEVSSSRSSKAAAVSSTPPVIRFKGTSTPNTSNQRPSSSASINKSDFFLNGSRLVPSVSSVAKDNVFSPLNDSTASRQSRLSVSSRTGMRSLNRNDFTNNSLNNSQIHKPDDSFLGKFWSYIAPS